MIPSEESLFLPQGQFHSTTPETGRLFSPEVRVASAGLTETVCDDSDTLLLLHTEEGMCDVQ